MKKLLFLVICIGFALQFQGSAQAGEYPQYSRTYRQDNRYRYYRHRPVRPLYCAPPGHVYRHYHFKSRWYYYGPYCGPRILPPVIVVPLPAVNPGYYVDVQCTVCKRWWRWRPEYPGQRPEGLPPCWQHHWYASKKHEVGSRLFSIKSPPGLFYLSWNFSLLE